MKNLPASVSKPTIQYKITDVSIGTIKVNGSSIIVLDMKKVRVLYNLVLYSFKKTILSRGNTKVTGTIDIISEDKEIKNKQPINATKERFLRAGTPGYATKSVYV